MEPATTTPYQHMWHWNYDYNKTIHMFTNYTSAC